MSSHIAVFDIGKTNKKLLVYDENLQLLDTATEHFPEYVDGEVHYERVKEMTEWYLQKLADFSSSYDIGAISVATQGATCVCVDKNGGIAAPTLAYTTEPGEQFHAEFCARYGGTEKIQRTTATAPMSNLLNLAQHVAYQQEHYPDQFADTYKILGFPQYFGYVLTGSIGAEPTYMGCHTMLWEHDNKRWSYIAEALGILDKLPDRLSRSWDILGKVKPEISRQTGISEETIVTLGIHDSNASLLPYLAKSREDFILNSTGTWCAVMHPAKTISFADDEIGKLVYYNLDVHSRPVKTSILLGGLEFETWSEEIKRLNGENTFPPFDPRLYEDIIKDRKLFIFPGIVRGTGQFPDSKPRVIENGKVYPLQVIQNGTIPDFFTDFPKAIAVLNISIAIQTKVAMERVGLRDGMPIFTEGGFQKNPDYNALITGIYPCSQVYLSNLAEATAFGAALLGKAASKDLDPLDLGDHFEIEKKEVPKMDFNGLSKYMEAFFSGLDESISL